MLYFRSEKRTKQWGREINIALYMFFTLSLILNIVSGAVFGTFLEIFLATKVMFS